MQESISCVNRIGSWQVHWYHAGSVFHSCSQRSTQNALQSTRTIGKKNTQPKTKYKTNAFSLYLPRRFSNHSGIIHVLPSQSFVQPWEHVTFEGFRPLTGFSPGLTGWALGARHSYSRRTPMIARPFSWIQPIGIRISAATNGNEAERGPVQSPGS